MDFHLHLRREENWKLFEDQGRNNQGLASVQWVWCETNVIRTLCCVCWVPEHTCAHCQNPLLYIQCTNMSGWDWNNSINIRYDKDDLHTVSECVQCNLCSSKYSYPSCNTSRGPKLISQHDKSPYTVYIQSNKDPSQRRMQLFANNTKKNDNNNKTNIKQVWMQV